jgi:hypothetical protein
MGRMGALTGGSLGATGRMSHTRPWRFGSLLGGPDCRRGITNDRGFRNTSVSQHPPPPAPAACDPGDGGRARRRSCVSRGVGDRAGLQADQEDRALAGLPPAPRRCRDRHPGQGQVQAGAQEQDDPARSPGVASPSAAGADAQKTVDGREAAAGTSGTARDSRLQARPRGRACVVRLRELQRDLEAKRLLAPILRQQSVQPRAARSTG